MISRILIALSLISTQTFVQQAAAQSSAHTSFWTGAAGNGLWNTAGNWNFGEDNLPASIAPQGRPAEDRNVLLSTSSAQTVNIKLSTNTSLSVVSGSGILEVREGSFAFDLNGRNLNVGDLILGALDGSTNGQVSFANAGAQVAIGLISLQIGGHDHDYLFADLKSTLGGAITGNITLDNSNRSYVLAGRNNSITVAPGQTFNNSIAEIVVKSGGTEASSNNVFEVDGGTLKAVEGIQVEGFYNDSDPENIVRANNLFLIHNGAQVGAGRVGGVGAGSEMRIETGGKLTVTDDVIPTFSVGEHGSLVIDGEGSELKGVSTILGGEAINLKISGDTVVSNGATLANAAIEIAAAGRLLFDSVDLAEPGTQAVNGRFEITDSTVTSGGIFLRSGSVAQFTDSEVTVAGDLQLNDGATAQILGNTTVEADRFASGGLLQVDEGSTFRFNKLITGGVNTLRAEGRIHWGSGGVTDSHAAVKVGPGTTLILEGGTYSVERFGVMEGGVLEGSGVIDASTASSVSGSVGGVGDGGFYGAEVRPGTAFEPGALSFIKGLEFYGSTSQIYLTVFGADLYDQIRGQVSGNNIVIHLELVPTEGSTLDELLDGLFADETFFQFFSDLNGNPIAMPNVTFDFGDTAAELASRSLTWNTSDFSEMGLIRITAIPEPSSMALALLGGCLAGLGMMARRSGRFRKKGRKEIP